MDLIDQFKKTQTFKYFYSTLLNFDESLNCFVATKKWREKEAELLTAAWWMFAEVAKAQVPEWISLNAKEPPLGTMVLICWSDAPDVEPEKDYMDHDVDHGVNYWANYNGGDEPSHWMPLPIPPQDQAHD